MTMVLARFGDAVSRFLHGPDQVEMVVGPSGPSGDVLVPRDGDGVWEVVPVHGRPCLAPDERSHYVYFALPAEFLARASRSGLWLDVEYWGDRYAQFRLQYASTDRTQPHDGLYKPAEQLWDGEAAGLSRFRRALFRLPDFDPGRTQNLGASFRVEFRREALIPRLVVRRREPEDAARFAQVAPLPDLRKMPGRFYPINYLFIEITNACNFKCTWCPDEVMDRRRGFMKKEKVLRLLDEVAAKRGWLGPIFPVKLHQMGEPMLHPDLPEIVAHAESRGVPIELNTNCGLITREKVDALYQAGLTNLILSYQTPDVDTFKTRKAPKLVFDEYRDKVRLAVERKAALEARTNIEIDIMNTKHADGGYRIVSGEDEAVALVLDWVAFCRALEARYGLTPRAHDEDRIRSYHFLDHDENGSRYALLDGVHLVWKRYHTWGNVIGSHEVHEVPDTYCPAPYDQLVIHWNGDVVACCTDYEGRTRTANVFASSLEAVWTSDVLKQRKKDMLEGRLLDVCARCQGVK
ncbi:MAG: radical SAM protein [Acidobacteria bacterium]|nr:radical SAM protein [Acidobacteriota bacterium]